MCCGSDVPMLVKCTKSLLCCSYFSVSVQYRTDFYCTVVHFSEIFTLHYNPIDTCIAISIEPVVHMKLLIADIYVSFVSKMLEVVGQEDGVGRWREGRENINRSGTSSGKDSSM